MKTIIISEFKAKCIEVLKEAQRTRQPVLITLRGKPLARIEPITEKQPKRSLGALKSRMKVLCDIVYMDTSDDWEML